MDVFRQAGSGWKTLLISMLLMACILSSGCTQTQEGRVYHVGILAGASAFLDITDGFKSGMTELGYIEGDNIIYDVRESNENRSEEQKIANEFVEDGIDLIFAFSTEAALIAKAAANGTGIPVVFAMGTTEETGLVESVLVPGDNITGVRFPGPDILIKGLEDLLELAPNTKRIWVILESEYPASIGSMELLRPAASSKGLTLIETNISSLEDLEDVLEERAELTDIGIDAIKMAPGVITLSPAGFAMISEFAAEHKVPIEGGPRFAAEQGAVFTSVPDNVEMGKLAASMADKIFRGTPAGTIPVVTPETRLTINYKRVQELGLTVPEGLLNRADEIIQ
jgi:putative ABC transport system substrate-binding protein